MKLNIVNVMNQIAAEEASVKLMKNFKIPTIEDIYREANEHGEPYNSDFAKWEHINGLYDYINKWRYEMMEREWANDQAADLCDWLMGHGESYEHVTFEKILSFDEWMKNEINITKKYFVDDSYLMAA